MNAEKLYKIKSRQVPYGFPESRRRMIDGYVLDNGTVLLDSMKDEDGNYIGGAGMDGMYLRTPNRYAPILDDNNVITAFRQVDDKYDPEPLYYTMARRAWEKQNAPPK